MNEGSMSRSKCNAWTAGITAALLALTFLLTSFSSQAQTFGTIGGVVKDQNGVLEFANVFLTTPGDTSKIISATVTDSLGQFTLINVSNGAYFLNVRFLGFKNKAVPVSVIQGKSVDIGTVDLAADPHVLQTVEVQQYHRENRRRLRCECFVQRYSNWRHSGRSP
jgi:hypothetical protein